MLMPFTNLALCKYCQQPIEGIAILNTGWYHNSTDHFKNEGTVGKTNDYCNVHYHEVWFHSHEVKYWDLQSDIIHNVILKWTTGLVSSVGKYPKIL